MKKKHLFWIIPTAVVLVATLVLGIVFWIGGSESVTQVNESYKTITCKCCGGNINLTLDGKCKLCGDSYDIAMHDWILTDAPIELTK